MQDAPETDILPSEETPETPETRGGRPKRILRRIALGLLALLIVPTLLVAAFAAWLLGTESGRETLLARVERLVLESSGWAVDAETFDLDLDLDGGRVTLRDVTAGASDAAPFARAAEVEAEVLWDRLLADGVRIERIATLSPTIDLAAPIPEAKSSDEPSGGGFRIGAMRVEDGRIVNGPAGGWLEAWSVEGANLEGSLDTAPAEDDAGLDVRVASATVWLDRRAGSPGALPEDADESQSSEVDPLPIALDGRVHGPLAGPWTIEDLAASGPGLELVGSGEVGAGEDEPIRVVFRLDAEPDRLAPELVVGADADRSTLHAEGDLELRALAGTVTLDADAFPPEILEPVLGAELLDTLGARGTLLDAVADLRLDGSPEEGLGGVATVVWRRGEDRLLVADATVEPTQAETPSILLRVDARALPDAPGTRRASGSLRAATWTDFADAPLEDGRVRVVDEDLDRLRRLVVRRWPSLEASLAGLPATGALDATVRAEGRFDAPRLDGEATWRPAPSATVRVEAQGRPTERRGTARFDLDGFDLQHLEPAWTLGRGGIDGSLTVRVGEQVAAEGRLSAPELTLYPPPPDSDENTADSEADSATPEPVTIEGLTLDFEAGGPRDDVSGRLDLVIARLAGGDDETGFYVEETSLGLRVREASLDASVDELFDTLRWRLEATTTSAELPGRPATLRELDLAVAAVGTAFDSIDIDGRAELPPEGEGPPIVLPFRVDGDGRLVRAGSSPVIESASLLVRLGRTVEGVDRLDVRVGLADGVLSVDLEEIVALGRRRTDAAAARLPLAALARLPGAGPLVDALPVAARADGPLDLSFDLPPLDSDAVTRWLATDTPSWQIRTTAAGSLSLDPSRPTEAVGSVVLRDTRIEGSAEEGVTTTVEALEPLRVEIADQRLRLHRAVWRAERQTFDVEGTLRLSPGWSFGDSPTALMRDVRGVAQGQLPATLAAPFLAGGTAEGVLAIDAVVDGTPEGVEAEIRIDGEDASFGWLDPYTTRFESPVARLRFVDGELRIERLTARFNEGDFELDGTVAGADQIDVQGFFDSVRYRLDYGLTVLLSGNLAYRAKPGEPPRIEANVLVDRGSLRRDIDAGRELLDRLLAPPELELPPVADEVGRTRLDVKIATVDGVRVKNNLADLRLSWSPPLEVKGTLAAPRVIGEIVAEPGGRLYTYGQVVRIDQGVLQFSGDPRVESTLDVAVTTSLEDPSIATPEDQQVLAELSRDPGRDFSSLSEEERQNQVAEGLASGLTTYYGDRIASRLGQALGRTTIRYRPLWIFGESDPQARLVISQDLSKYLALGVAIDLTDSEQETYLLDIHDLPGLRSFSGTVFTSEESSVGATIQQQITFGGPGGDAVEDDATTLRLAELRVVCPSCADSGSPRGKGTVELPKRAMRRAVDLEEGDPLPEGIDFDAEIEVAEALRDAGWVDPTVNARLDADMTGERADLVVEIEPGPFASFRFSGAKPPDKRLDSIRSLYRADFYEEASLEDMREQTLRVWRSLGHPDAEVEVRVEPVGEDTPEKRADRFVIVHSEPGEALELEPVRIDGVPDDVATSIAARFPTQQSRVELGTGAGSATERLVDALRRVGFPDARVVEQRLDREAEQPVVRVDAGPRRRVESIRIEGAPDSERETIRGLIPVEIGSPLVSPELASATLEIERHLRSNGWNEAEVRLELKTAEASADERIPVRFEIAPGPRRRLAAVEVEGAKITQEQWVERLSGLEVGSWLDASAVADARRELLETNLFDRVRADIATNEEDDAVVRFALDELPRYRAAYGLRWESEDGLGAVFDIFDRNATGRGIGLGLRALWIEDEKALRLYSNVPRLLNSPLELDLFVEGFDEDDEGRLAEGWEASAQITWPLRPGTRVRSYVRYRRADVVDTRLLGDNESRESTPVVGLQIFHDGRDDPLDPRRGFFTSLDLSGSENLLSGDDSYLRAFGQLDFHLPLPFTGDRLVWSQGVRLGVAEVYQGELPRDERFFAGGQRSVRGYESRSLGPEELLPVEGEPRALGGEAVVVLNQELRYDFTDAIVGVIFFDAGQVFRDLDDLSFELGVDPGSEAGLRRSIGLGARYRSPIGLLRLDLAHALDRREEQDDEFEIYLGFGHAF